MFTELATIKLQQSGYKITKPRTQIITFFQDHKKAVSPYDIQKEQNDLDVVSIYRTIELLENLGLIHKVWSLGGYVRCNLSNEKCHDDWCHEFQVCTKCGNYKEVHGHHKHISGNDGFQTIQHISEQLGFCEGCK